MCGGGAIIDMVSANVRRRCGVARMDCSGCVRPPAVLLSHCFVFTDISAEALYAGALEAGVVDAGEVDAGEVEAGGVEAGGVEAGEVEAGEVEAGEVEDGGVEAGEGEDGECEHGGVEDAGVEHRGTYAVRPKAALRETRGLEDGSLAVT